MKAVKTDTLGSIECIDMHFIVKGTYIYTRTLIHQTSRSIHSWSNTPIFLLERSRTCTYGEQKKIRKDLCDWVEGPREPQNFHCQNIFLRKKKIRRMGVSGRTKGE